MPLAIVANVDTASPQLLHVHADHLDRPIMLTNTSKANVWEAVYRPFGEVHAITGTATQNLRFPGQYFLFETGLAHNWHRTYDATIGRYLQADPLGFVDGPSVYSYVRSSPTNLIDPTGQNAVVVIRVFDFVLRGVIFAMTLPKPPPVVYAPQNVCDASNSPPPGNCSWDQYNMLRSEVLRICGHGAEDSSLNIPACKGTNDLATNVSLRKAFLSCAEARERLSNTCFSGGERGHNQAARDARRAAANCEGHIRRNFSPRQ